MFNLNFDEYKDKVLGCWYGKNIGGTLGTENERDTSINNVSFLPDKNKDNPAPNDDLDLQLVWLAALERYGVQGITKERLAEMWMGHIIGPWGEYVNCKLNIANGLYPPLSGSCNNDVWRNSNGAWIRSEIWACICPGAPDEAIEYAYMDSCVDHSGEGIYSEMFTAAAESAAFVLNDLRQIIEVGLSKIPEDSLTAELIRLAIDGFDRKLSWQETRNLIVEKNTLGWFQAPANVAFAVVGLLYGEGDFGKTVCRAVNCGDDTDCTGVFAGALLGIMLGKKGLPDHWCNFIGKNIITCAINKFEFYECPIPENVDELTERVVKQGLISSLINAGTVPALSSGKTEIPAAVFKQISGKEWAARIHQRSPYELEFHAPFAEISVDYENGPFCTPGEAKKITVRTVRYTGTYDDISWRWILPESWSADVATGHLIAINSGLGVLENTLIPGEFPEAVTFVPLEVTLASRRTKCVFQVPFVLKNTFNYVVGQLPDKFARDWKRWNKNPHLPMTGFALPEGM